MNRRLPLLAVLGLASLGLLASSGTADAGRYRFSGGGHVHARIGGSFHARVGGGVSVRFSRPAYRSYSRPWLRNHRWGVRGHIYVGPRRHYAYYPRTYYYPRYYYYYRPVPSYYGVYSQSYYPVQPAATTTAPVAVAERPPLPKLGVGLFAGGAAVEGTDGASTKDSNDVGLLGRLRLTTGLLVEAEIGKTSYQNDLRVDRRIGGSLVYEFGAYNKLAPYVLAGLGVQQAEVGDNQYTTTQDFGELGVGLRYALSEHLHVLFDVRAGSRATRSSDAMPNTDVATRQVTPPSASSNDNENYTRARLAAVLMF